MAEENSQIQPAATDGESRKSMLAEQFAALEQPAEPKPDRPRDETGKFAPKEKQEAAPKAETKSETQPEPAKEPAWKKPPASWKKEKHPLWETAPDELREYAWQRENEMKAGVEPLKTKAQFADAISKVIEPYIPTINSLGIDAPTAIAALMKADYTLRNSDPASKRNYFLQLAQSYGVDLSGVKAEELPATMHPMISALQNDFQQLKGHVLTWQQMQEQQENAHYMTEIEDFKQSAEHFDEVRPTMIELLRNGMAQNLTEAYNKAIRLNDELSERIATAKQAKSEAEKRETADRAAKAAKAAAVSVKSSTPGTPTPAKAQDRRSMLREQFAGIGERL